MKKLILKSLALVTAFAVIFTSFIFPQVTNVNAESTGTEGTVKFSKNMTIPYAESGLKIKVKMASKPKKGQKISVKFSKPKVAEVYANKGYAYIEGWKTGKGKLTIKIGKKKYKATVNIVKYKNPFKKVKIGSANCTQDFKAMAKTDAEVTKNSVKVTVKAKKGWKIKKIVRTYSKKDKKIKNGSVIKLKNGGASIVIHMKNKETGVTLPFYINIWNSREF